MNVTDLMAHEVVTLDAADHLDLAHDIMQLGRIRHMPVVSKGKLIGVLSQRDLFRAALSSALDSPPTEERKWLAKVAVGEVMTSPVETVTPETSIHTALDLMITKRIGCLPVIEAGRLIGLLSESDCLRYLSRVLDINEAKSDLPEIPEG